MSEDDAHDILMKGIEGKPISEPRAIPFKTGRLAEPWSANCTAIGLSAGFLEPLESTSIHLICKYALMLEGQLYSGQHHAAAREAFNAAWRKETDEVRDFLLAHYVVNARPEEFWIQRRETHRPAALDAALGTMRQMGWMDLPNDALFGHDSWFQVLIGQELDLDYAKFAVTHSEAQKVMGFLQNVGRAIATEVQGIPRTHQEMLTELLKEARTS